MVQIVVTAEQAKQLAESREAIEILDPSGKRIGYYTQPFTNSDITAARQRSATQPGGKSTQEVLDRLLTEAERRIGR